jgi:hypothetical protein
MPIETQNSSAEKQGEVRPYSYDVVIVPQEKINQRVNETVKDIYANHLVANDKVKLSSKWKGKMTKFEKLRK